MKIQTQIKAGGIGLNHNQTEVRTVEKPGTCLADAAGGGAAVSSDAEAGGAATGTTQAEPQSDLGTPEGLSTFNHNQTFIRKLG